MANDLWPDFAPATEPNGPLTLLREQADVLARKTKGIVKAEVEKFWISDWQFYVSFDLLSPLLGAYRYKLLEMSYPPSYYPLEIKFDGRSIKVADEQSFLIELGRVLSSAKTKQIVETIMVHAKAAEKQEA
jgi:hypothetical protein